MLRPIVDYFSGVVGIDKTTKGNGILLINDAAENITVTIGTIPPFIVKTADKFVDLDIEQLASITLDPVTLGTKQVETATVVSPGVAQVETAAVVGTIVNAGNAAVIVTSAGMTGSPKTVSVAVDALDTNAQVGGKIRTALIADAAIGAVATGKFTITGANENIILTANAAAADDATLNVSIANGTCTGLTAAPTSTDTTAGVAPGITTAGNASVVVTAAGMTGSPITLSVPLLTSDSTATLIATKIKAALNANAVIAAMWSIGGTGAAITLTKYPRAVATDATLNVALADDTCVGITTAASSADTTAGTAATAIAYRCWVKG